MKEFDFFICHSSKDKDIVQNIVNCLEKNGASCWLAPRNCEKGKSYAASIINGINASKIFLLCLSENSGVSEHVLNEIETVYQDIGEDNIMLQPLFIEQFDIDDKKYKELRYYIKRLQFIVPKKYDSAYDIAKEVIISNRSIFEDKQSEHMETTGIGSYYIDEKENRRLELQSQIGLKFDYDIYKSIISKYNAPNILDVGCGNGKQITQRLREIDNYFLIGIDKNETALKQAKTLENDQIKFFNIDIESDKFIDELKKIMEANCIQGFDVINLAYILRHLKNPGSLLYKLRRFLKEDGILIIREYDGCFEFFYPDEKQYFSKLSQMFNYDDYSGNSHIGLAMHSLLYKAGYENIKLEKCGYSTIGYTIDEKEIEYDVSFAYIKDDLYSLLKEFPDNEKIRADYEWYIENESYIRESFMDPSFVFFGGRMLFTAKRK